MLRVGLRGVFARKLRAVLTALAVFLGVALMTGTYVLTDTFTNSFGQIFSESNQGVDVAVVPREIVDSRERRGPAAAPGSARRRGAEGGRRRRGRGWHLRPGRRADRRGRRPDRLHPGTRLRRLGAARAVRPVRVRRGPAADGGRRGGDRQALRRQRGPGRRRPREGQRRGGGARVRDRRRRDARRGRLVRRRDRGDPAARRGAAAGRQGGRDRPDLDRRGGGRHARRAEAPRRRRDAARGGGPHRRGERAAADRRHRGRPRVPEDRPPGLRVGRAVRGRVHDLQHVLDHGRAAHARVRDAAHARGIAAPGADLRHARGGRHRRDRGRARARWPASASRAA